MIEAVLAGGWKSILTATVLIFMSIVSLASIIMEAARLRREMRSMPLSGGQPEGVWLLVHDAYDRSLAAGYAGKKLGLRMQVAVREAMGRGLAPSTALASIGSNAPYIGLFGTVIGIYGALQVLGGGGSITPDRIAGPVGEALVMTALGLLVAIPAVMGYNAIGQMRRRLEDMLLAYAVYLQTGSMSGAHMRTLERGKSGRFTENNA